MKDRNHVMIITGGACEDTLVERLIKEQQVDTVIAVDGGLKLADRLQLMPDYIVGDFDTIEPEIIERYKVLTKRHESNAPKVLSFRPEKDDTDTEIAVRLCIELKVKKVTIVGATGTRLDHTLANIHMLKNFLESGIEAAIYDCNNKIYLTDHNLVLRRDQLYGENFSMLPFTESVTGITLKGFKYPLKNKTISLGTSLCISNVVLEETASLEFDTGILIVFETLD